MKKLLIIPALFMFAVSTFAQSVDFKLNPEIGKPAKMKVINKTDVDGAQSMIMALTLNMTVVPTKKENDNITFEYVTNSVKADLDAGMMTMSYDSEVESTNDVSQMLEGEFSKIIGKKITSTMTAKGQIVSTDIPEGLGEGLDESLINSFFAQLPLEPKKVGDTWANSIVENKQFGNIEATSTFKEENAGGYVISLLGKILTPEGNQLGEFTGEYILDKKSHLTKSGTINMSLDFQGTKVISDIFITSE